MLLLSILSAAAAEPELLLPEPQACLEGLFADDPEFAVFEGLSVSQIADSMDAFTPALARCMPASRGVQGSLTLQVTVGCDGRVVSATVEESSALPESVVACVAETVVYAAFPAHDTPDPIAFLYPMTIDVPRGAAVAAR